MNRDISRSFRSTIAALLVTFCGISCAQSRAAKPHAKVSLISDKLSLAPGNSQWIGLRFELEPGWHIYWTNPGDSGEPPKVTWQLSSGMQASDLHFPAPQRIADHGLTDYGYLGQVVLLSKLTVPASVTSKTAEIAADVRYLVCREVCVPAKERVAVTLPLDATTKQSAENGVIQTANASLPQSLPEDVHVSAVSDRDSFVLTVASKDAKFGPVHDFIPADAQIIENTIMPVVEHSGNATRLRLKKSEQLSQPVTTLRGLLIANDKAYEVAMPVTASKNSGTNGSSKKAVSQKIQAPTSNSRSEP